MERSIRIQTAHRVRVPVSVTVWYSGREGTTVGRGATELVALKASTGSTIMAAAWIVEGGWDGGMREDEEIEEERGFLNKLRA
jgi:hypothetical protein